LNFLITETGCCTTAASALSLSLFEAGILLVDYIQLTLSSHNLAIGTALFDGCPYFHCFCFCCQRQPLAILDNLYFIYY
jgi:hypothetical protein